MIYLIISSSGSYQLNSFNPHMLNTFSKNTTNILTDDLRPANTKHSSIEDRIAYLNRTHQSAATYTYLPPVATQADLLTTYPELFI